MKSFIIILLTVISTSSFGQTKDCALAKTGTFQLISPQSGKTIIERTETTQKETNSSMGIEAIYDILWIDSCTYELRNKKLLKGDTRYQGLPTDVLKVEIMKIEGDKISVRSSANFSPLIIEREITKIK